MDQATGPNIAIHLLFTWHPFSQQSTLQLVLFKLNTLHKDRAIRALMRVGRWGRGLMVRGMRGDGGEGRTER